MEYILEKDSSPDSGLTDHSIANQLDTILGHGLFKGSPVLCSFLRFIVAETLNGNARELKEYTIGINALGKKVDFNPQTDAIVRIHAGRLRKLLAEYYSGQGIGDEIVIEVVKGSYVPMFRRRSPFQATDKEIDVEPANHRRSSLTLAVLPFRNLCPDSSYQFFADGFGEELTALFSSFRDISVIAHHSARKYAKPEYDIRSIGQELGAHYLITGSVRRTKSEIRINVCLSETLEGTQVWAKSYREALEEDGLFEVQDHIITEIYGKLGGYYGFIIHDALISARRRKSLNIETFDAVLWNYYCHMDFSRDAYLKTREALEDAIRRDPHYATGMAFLSELYLDALTLGYPTVADPLKESFAMAKRAVILDPECHHAHRSFGWASIYLKRKTDALQAMEQCLKLNPYSVSNSGAMGFGMACVGEYDRALDLLDSSISLNPHCPWWFYLGYFLVYFHRREFTKALEAAERISVPEVFFDPLTKAAARGKLGLLDPETIDTLRVELSAFHSQLCDMKKHLSSIILDGELVDEILDGLALSGLART